MACLATPTAPTSKHRRALAAAVDADVAVVGAGAVGLSIAWHAAKEGLRVVVLEKDARPGGHQSSRNSGVIHPGHNLAPGTAKARYCVEGARQLRTYCADRGVAVIENGILVVARTQHEAATLGTLADRARQNQVKAQVVDAEGIKEIEPAAAGVAALHAPEGASLDAAGYVQALARDAQAAGADLRLGVAVAGWDEDGQGVRVRLPGGHLTAKVLVNAAGLHADRVASALAPDLRVVPFRGTYAEVRPERRHLVRGHVYSVPDLRFPFLGVHLSRRFDGRVVAGPGAMLAFGREAYRLRDVDWRDLGSMLAWPGFYRLLARPSMQRLVGSEVNKSLRLRAVWKEARRLVPSLGPRDLVRGFAGNRAQMVDRQGRLVQDMVVRTTARTVHVLNAVSPGLTASLPFGEHVADLAVQRAR